MTTDAFDALLEQLRYPGSTRLRAILEYLMTAGQAEIILQLPGTVAEVVAKSDHSEDAVQATIGTLVGKGVVWPRIKPGSYRVATDTLMLHDTTVTARDIDPASDRRLYELWEDFSQKEEYPRLGKTYAAAAEPFCRVMPAVKALEGIDDVPPWDDFREVIKAQETISVIPCPCRMRKAAVGDPCECAPPERHEVCLQFGAVADAAVARGSGRRLTMEEALALVDEVEDDGFIHTWNNTRNTEGVPHSCQCCQDCCVLYQSLDMVGESIGKAWAKSRYGAYVDDDACDGCQDCVERCHFDAIELMRPETTGGRRAKGKRLKARVDPENCYGCGVCVLACTEQKAMKFKLVREEAHVPAAV